MELGWVSVVHCCQELLPISSSASAPAAETSTSKDAWGVGMPCLCELLSLPFFFFWDPISVWTLWNYFFKKTNPAPGSGFLRRWTRTAVLGKLSPGAVALDPGGSWWFHSAQSSQ